MTQEEKLNYLNKRLDTNYTSLDEVNWISVIRTQKNDELRWSFIYIRKYTNVNCIFNLYFN